MESRHAPVIGHRVATGYSHAIQVLGCDEPGKTELAPDTLAGAVLVVDDMDLVCQNSLGVRESEKR